MLLNKSFTFCLLLLSLCLCSCFEVVEDMTVTKNGSGTMKLTINMSQSKTKLAAIMLMDSIRGNKVPEPAEIRRELDKTTAQLERMPGISNVKNSLDLNDFVVSISFSFTKAEDVNQLMKSLLTQYNVQNAPVVNYHYSEQDARFSKDYKYSGAVKEQYNKLNTKDKEIFSPATYISIYRFELPVSDYSNKQAKVSKNQLALMQRCQILDLINGKTNISNQVQLSK
jgi:hypothetical protein